MKPFAIVAAIVASGAIGCAGTAPAYTHVAPRVSVVRDRSLAMRADAGVLWASAGTAAEPHRVWTMPGKGAVEKLRLASKLGEEGYIVTFRQGGVVWWGELDGSRAVRGPLRPVLALEETMSATAGR